MVSREIIISKIVEFINGKLANLSSSNPLIMIFIKPFFTRMVDNNIYKLDSLLKLIQDKDGNVDIEGISSEIIDGLLVAKAKEFPDILAGLTIGNGIIKINVPMTNKQIIINSDDIENFKKSIIK